MKIKYYIFNKFKWDDEIKKLHNGVNPFIDNCKWVDICNGLRVEKVNLVLGIINIGDEYEDVIVPLKN